MVLAIEPMVNVGTHHVRMGQDNWAVYSQDGSLAAHFEHTVAITADGPRILTPWHELVPASASPRLPPRPEPARSSSQGWLERGLASFRGYRQNSTNPRPYPSVPCPAWPRAVLRGRRTARNFNRACYSCRSAWSRLLGSALSSSRYGPDSRSYEGPRLSQAHVREVQGHPPRRCGPRDLSKPASQAAAGVTGY